MTARSGYAPQYSESFCYVLSNLFYAKEIWHSSLSGNTAERVSLMNL